MDIKLLRIDSRLVHGQVANNWAGSLGAEAILAVSDGAANDELRKTLMLQTGGGKVKVHVLTVAKAGRVYKNPKYENLKAVIVVETPADIVRLLDLGIQADEVNVGGMTFKQGTKALSQAVYVSDEDVEAFKEIDSRGITQYIQQVPSSGRSGLMEALKSKGFMN
ncbi:PTS sugar transporter subunit IIB [Actinomyces sp. MRS3W]|uniref:PTS system mannose/fructose/N-acetylgalactosamine-transporter subunit IIB n=1 Tax=Actinomyces sp. MRS3W TaxID=2800796 RepID=UPI0028FDA8A1|nr:PTS sugar transporter subunit IIB [Actinomyces sp. MRS3W]MDU0349662.1 PTS sugar transporter subunit IIB [Actinomyces sp. MRS3W]